MIFLRFFLLILVVAMAILGFKSHSLALNERDIALKPSFEHPLGSDFVGRDYLTLLAKATFVTLTLGLYTAVIALCLALIVALATRINPCYDRLLMRLAELVQALPLLPLVLVLSGFVGFKWDSLAKMGLSLSLVAFISWPVPAILLRNLLASLQKEGFILMAKTIGYSPFYIAYRYALPRVKPLLKVYSCRLLARVLLAESALSFLGFGITEPNVSLGLLLSYAKQFTVMQNFSYQWMTAGGLLTFIIFFFYFFSQERDKNG